MTAQPLPLKGLHCQYCDVYGGGGTRDEMTGSSSVDWILLSLRLQPFLITLSHNTNDIPYILQMLLTLVHPVLICIHNSLTALSGITLHWLTAAHFKSSNHTSRFLLRLSLNANCPPWTLNWTDTSYRPNRKRIENTYLSNSSFVTEVCLCHRCIETEILLLPAYSFLQGCVPLPSSGNACHNIVSFVFGWFQLSLCALSSDTQALVNPLRTSYNVTLSSSRTN
jgi:hypothetical protein